MDGADRFRALVLTDAELVAAMHSACFPDAMSASGARLLLGVRTTWGTLAYREAGPGPDPVGYCIARGTGAESEILDFGILPVFRRRGLGRALLRAVVGEARRRGVRKLFLEVADDNPAGRGLYADAGFLIVGHRPGYYRRSPNRRVDALLMCLELSTEALTQEPD